MDLCRLLESVVNDLDVITKVTHLLKSSWNYVIILFSIFGTIMFPVFLPQGDILLKRIFRTDQ